MILFIFILHSCVCHFFAMPEEQNNQNLAVLQNTVLQNANTEPLSEVPLDGPSDLLLFLQAITGNPDTAEKVTAFAGFCHALVQRLITDFVGHYEWSNRPNTQSMTVMHTSNGIQYSDGGLSPAYVGQAIRRVVATEDEDVPDSLIASVSLGLASAAYVRIVALEVMQVETAANVDGEVHALRQLVLYTV
jgi:hypothetical protein